MNVNDPRWASIDAFVEENRDNILRDITRLVAVPSVEGAPEPGAPFGPGPKAALAKALEIADELGLDTFNADSYIGWAETGRIADGQKFLATITHTDVVPEGNGWDADPYTVRVRDGWLLGRGVADDKGPAVLTLYAAKFFKQQGATLPYTLRILLGANEETGMKDVDYYLEHYPQPAFCFTPDAEFPVCYGEKGGYGGWLVSAPLHGSLIDFQGGVAHNVVPDRAYALVRADASALKDTENVKVTAEADGVARISAFGKGGHAAMPAGTVNAIALVVDYLLDNRLCSEEEARALEMLRRLHASTDGSSVGIAAQDDVFDPLTCVGGVIKLENGALRQSIDIRFPTSTNAETLCAALSKLAQDAGGSFLPDSARVPFYIDPNTPVIQTLIRTYNDVTGKNAQPFTMGGGTYARHFPYAVSFGPEHTDIEIPSFAGPMHGANEGTPFEKLVEALKIYILALLRLQEIEL